MQAPPSYALAPALVPPLRTHLTRYHGMFAPNHCDREDRCSALTLLSRPPCLACAPDCAAIPIIGEMGRQI